MKNFMLLVVSLALLSGCATTVPSAEREEEVNPHSSKNSELLEGAGGAILFNYLARATGAGQTLSYIAGGAGAIAGVNHARSRQWRPGDDEIIHLDQPLSGYSSGYSVSGYTTCGHVSVYCDRTPKQGMAPPRPGMCNDPDSGGEASFDDLQKRAQQRAGCYSSSSSGYAQPQYASYNNQPTQSAIIVSYPSSTWGRNNNKQKAKGKKASRLNIGNYTEKGAVHAECQTGNWEMDSACLKDWSKEYATLQKRCVEEKLTNNPDCRKNPGVVAAEYKVLSDELLLRQKEEQGGEFVKN